MTRTLEIPSELDAQIERLAREHGVDADLLFKESVTRLCQQITEMAEELITKMEEDRIDVSSPGRVELMTFYPAADYVVMSGTQVHSAQVSLAQMPVETREERRARIQGAIDEAQRHFAPMMHGGDAVSQFLNEKRADVKRAAERGL